MLDVSRGRSPIVQATSTEGLRSRRPGSLEERGERGTSYVFAGQVMGFENFSSRRKSDRHRVGHRRVARCRSQLRYSSAIAFRRPSFAGASMALISSFVGFTATFLRIRRGATRTGALDTPFRLTFGNCHSTLSGEKPSEQSSGWRKRFPGDFSVRSQRSLMKRSIDDRHCSTTNSSELIIRKYCSLRNASLSMQKTKNEKRTLSSFLWRARRQIAGWGLLAFVYIVIETAHISAGRSRTEPALSCRVQLTNAILCHPG